MLLILMPTEMLLGNSFFWTLCQHFWQPQNPEAMPSYAAFVRTKSQATIHDESCWLLPVHRNVFVLKRIAPGCTSFSEGSPEHHSPGQF